VRIKKGDPERGGAEIRKSGIDEKKGRDESNGGDKPNWKLLNEEIPKKKPKITSRNCQKRDG